MAYSNFSEACDFPKTGKIERTFCLIFRKFSSNQNNEKKHIKNTKCRNIIGDDKPIKKEPKLKSTQKNVKISR